MESYPERGEGTYVRIRNVGSVFDQIEESREKRPVVDSSGGGGGTVFGNAIN
jgi:hypothetical protein